MPRSLSATGWNSSKHFLDPYLSYGSVSIDEGSFEEAIAKTISREAAGSDLATRAEAATSFDIIAIRVVVSSKAGMRSLANIYFSPPAFKISG